MKRAAIAMMCSAVLAWPLAASAAGGGGGGGGGGAEAEAATVQRNKDPDYAAGMAAKTAKDWQQVISRMDTYVKRKPDDADGWNELGYAYRKSGQLPPALDAYDKALKINPKHRGAHEYLGEAYLQMNDLARAEQELKTLDKLCFFPCEEFTDLKQKIGDYKKTKQAAQ